MIDLDIPGLCPKHQLEFIVELGKRVPPHGKIVEVGSLFGRSAFSWAASCPKSVTVYCVDPWAGHEFQAYTGSMVADDYIPIKLISTKQQFLANMQARKIENIVPIQGESPLADGWDNPDIDLAYIDGAHGYEEVAADLEFWGRHLKKSGVLCGDDYCTEEFPGVVRAVEEYAAKNGLSLRRYRRMWLLVSEDNRSWLKEAWSAFLAKQPRKSSRIY